MINYSYKSIFAPHFMSFVRMKASMGFTTPKIEYILKELDELFIVMDTKEPILTCEMVRIWRESRLNDSMRTLYDKYSIISQFSRYMCHCGFISYVPPMPRQKDKYFVPKIFTTEEITRFFGAVDNLQCKALAPNHSLFSMPALFRTLYATGIRIGEAVRLNNEDVNFQKQQIIINTSKNQRQRIIPINKELEKVLKQYVNNRSKMPIKHVDSPNAPFFINYTGTSVSTGSAYNWFRKVLKKCDIPFIGGNKGPRLHDLRHTFAVHSLMKQVQSGKDIYCLLPVLSVFMGHKTLTGTEAYVRLTSEMFPELNLQIGAISSYVFPSLEKIIREEYEE